MKLASEWKSLSGSIVGGIIGDAAGACFEFTEENDVLPREIQDFLNPELNQNVFGYPAGTFTDDSIQMILFMELVVETQGQPTVEAYKEKLLGWIHRGHWTPGGRCFDVGDQTVVNLMYGRGPDHLYQEEQGNGGIMRIAPFAWFFKGDHREIVRYNSLTHPSTVCNAAAIAMSDLITGKRGVEETTDLVEGMIAQSNGYYRPGSAWVLSTLLQALYMIQIHRGEFERGLASIINQGGDTDTIACVYGQIWGSIYGVSKVYPKLYQFIWRFGEIADLLALEFTRYL